MHTASSAKRTCRESRSTSEWTATVLMPSSLQAQMILVAISPRFAIRIFLNILCRDPCFTAAVQGPRHTSSPSHLSPLHFINLERMALSAWKGDARSCPDAEQGLIVLDWLAVFDINLGYGPADLGLYFVHQLHGLDDAHYCVVFNSVSNLDKGLRLRRWRPVKGTDNWRLYYVDRFGGN